MKQHLRNFLLATLGGLLGTLLHVRLFTASSDYHWARSLLLSSIVATSIVAYQHLRRH